MLKFELSEQMVQIIGDALGSAPFKIVAPVIAELQKQINAQQPKPNGNGGPIAFSETEITETQ